MSLQLPFNLTALLIPAAAWLDSFTDTGSELQVSSVHWRPTDLEEFSRPLVPHGDSQEPPLCSQELLSSWADLTVEVTDIPIYLFYHFCSTRELWLKISISPFSWNQSWTFQSKDFFSNVLLFYFFLLFFDAPLKLMVKWWLLSVETVLSPLSFTLFDSYWPDWQWPLFNVHDEYWTFFLSWKCYSKNPIFSLGLH